jgi:hypothetical protein
LLPERATIHFRVRRAPTSRNSRLELKLITSNSRGKKLLWGSLIGIAGLLALAGCTSEPTAETPETSLSSLPASPITDKTVRCLNDAGWDATRSPSGGFNGPPNLNSAQLEKYDEASAECSAKTGWDTAWTDLSDAQIEELYGQELVEQKCLAEAGYDGGPPPSLQSYQDNFHTADQYYAIQNIHPETLEGGKFNELISKCPPPSWFLNLKGL